MDLENENKYDEFDEEVIEYYKNEYESEVKRFNEQEEASIIGLVRFIISTLNIPFEKGTIVVNETRRFFIENFRNWKEYIVEAFKRTFSDIYRPD